MHLTWLLLQILWMIAGMPFEGARRAISPMVRITDSATVFMPGQSGYDFFRIPALTRSDDRIFAFAEGRLKSLNDHGQIDIVMRVSRDGGITWGELTRVVHFPDQSCQNPTPVWVEEDNKLLLLFTRRTEASDTEQMIRSGNSEGYVGAYLTESTDHGKTWSPVREITAEVKMKPWRWYAFGPGGAIIMKHHERYRGRIVVPANHSTPEGPENEYLGAHLVYSDDRGATWKIGAIDSRGSGIMNPNETTMAETATGRLYVNTRNQHHGPGARSNRGITWSDDGGESFLSPFVAEPQLVTPVVHASLTASEERCFFVAPSHTNERRNLSVWVGDARGAVWSAPATLYPGPAAYSSSLLLDPATLAVLAEKGVEGPYEEIVFYTVNLP